jgi:predicted nucleotidyltransferase component of viral defense system
VQDAQVEQDLVISRALAEMVADPDVGARLAFRGGTALFKLHLRPAACYSEDIDLVQMAPAQSVRPSTRCAPSSTRGSAHPGG